jgi:site-specific DNA-adenine methylase
MLDDWDSNILTFLELCNKHDVRMLMVGGGAVNFHGYQRHSADVDFWLETTNENLLKLIRVLNEMGYEVNDFPESVKNQEQNISMKFSPTSIAIELITRFSVNRSFDQAYNEAEIAQVEGYPLLKWNVLNFDDLITSKIKSSRPKDLLDIQELKRLKKE